MKTLICLLSLLAPLLVIAEDAKMPADAQKIIDKYDKAIAEAKKVYDAAVAKARDQALKELKPIQTAETKKGNLDSAMLVKNKIEELTIEGATPKEGDLASPTSPQFNVKMLLGKWKITLKTHTYTGIWEFKENGVVILPEGKGTWEIGNDKILIKWGDGKRSGSMEFPANNALTAEGTCNEHVAHFERKK